jgi:hypothetical protein
VALNAKGQGADDLRQSIQRAACALANSTGGFIMFGVQDRSTKVPRAIDRIVGIPVGGDLRKEFADKIRELRPEVHFETTPKPIVLPTDSRRGVFVVSIPLNPSRPHMVRSTGVFYKRSDGGSAEQMDFYEVRDQMLFTEEHRRKLVLLRLEVLDYRETSSMIRQNQPRPHETNLRFDTGAFKSLVADVVELLPTDLEFLRLLVSLPTLADGVNRRIDEALQRRMLGQVDQYVQEIGHHAQVVHTEVTSFDQRCEQAQRRLDELFGPLVGPE